MIHSRMFKVVSDVTQKKETSELRNVMYLI